MIVTVSDLDYFMVRFDSQLHELKGQVRAGRRLECLIRPTHKPVDCAAVYNWGKHPKSLSELVSNGLQAQNYVNVEFTDLHERFEGQLLLNLIPFFWRKEVRNLAVTH